MLRLRELLSAGFGAGGGGGGGGGEREAAPAPPPAGAAAGGGRPSKRSSEAMDAGLFGLARAERLERRGEQNMGLRFGWRQQEFITARPGPSGLLRSRISPIYALLGKKEKDLFRHSCG